MTHGEFLKSLFHKDTEAVQNFVKINKDVQIEYDNSEPSLEGLPVHGLIDEPEARWYKEHKGYSQKIKESKISQLPSDPN